MNADWRFLTARYPGTCRKGSGGCGRDIAAGSKAWMRLPAHGRRHFTVLMCTRCGERKGLVIEA